MIRLLTIILLSAISSAVISSAEESPLTEADSLTLEAAIKLVDNGMVKAALIDFDKLSERYPDNYTVQYERMLALSHLNRFKEVEVIGRRLIKHKDVSRHAYHLLGEALALQNKRTEARKILKKGMKLFPDAGLIYHEYGNIALDEKDYNLAIEAFNLGIDAEPACYANYYAAARMFLPSNYIRIWGLIFAETAILIGQDAPTMHKNMGDGIRQNLLESISAISGKNYGFSSVPFLPSEELSLPPDPSQHKPAFAFDNVYGGCLALATESILTSENSFSGTIEQLAEIRRTALDIYLDKGSNLFGSSMYLLPFQKKIIDAGHWEAYNYYIFSECSPTEFNTWLLENTEKFQAFAGWYHMHPLILDSTHTVGIGNIARDYRHLSEQDVDRLRTILFHPQ